MYGLKALLLLDGRTITPNLFGAFSDHDTDVNQNWISGSIGLSNQLIRNTTKDTLESQPLFSEDKRYVLIADARLDNRTELQKALAISTQEESTLSDSKFILRAFQKWNEDCSKYLIGDFAFIVWDQQERRLFCSRDHLGVRPLFYYRSTNLLALASAPKGLFTLPEVPRRLNANKIADYLALIGDSQSSFYADIYRLPAAYNLVATFQGIRIFPYWFPDPNRTIRYSADADYAEAFRELLSDVVRRQLRSQYSIGISLSGGLDSPSIASMAAYHLEKTGKRLITYTSVPRPGFDGPRHRKICNDETPFVRAIQRKQSNIDAYYISTEGKTFLDFFKRWFSVLEAPILNPCNGVWSQTIMDLAHQQGVRVLLHGSVGNITISYDGIGLLPELALHCRWLSLLRELRAYAAVHRISVPMAFKRAVLKPLLPDAWWAAYGNLKKKPIQPWLEYSAINPLFATEVNLAEHFHQLKQDPTFRAPANGWSWRKQVLTGGILYDGHDAFNAQRVECGVEVRSPTVDKRIVEFCLAIPEEQYLRNGQNRYLIRRAMDGILPPEIVWKNQHGTQAPDWYERLTAARSRVIAEIKRLEKIELARLCLDLSRMRRLAEHWPQGDWSDARVVSNYRFVLQRGLTVGSFIRWFEEGDQYQSP